MYRGKKTFRLEKESRGVFFCYVFIRKKLPVTGSVDTKKQKFCKKIKKRDNSENSVSEKVKIAPVLVIFSGI